MSLESEGVAVCVGVPLIKHTFLLNTRLALLLLHIDPLLARYSLFHVHGICPVSFTLENQKMQKFFVRKAFVG